MKFLFVSPGYPGCGGVASGSGVGTYVRELALGLTERGHECHIIAWSENRCGVAPAKAGKLRCLCDSSEVCAGVSLHAIGHSYWPLLERFLPDSRDVHKMGVAASDLDKRIGFDWVEVESDEGLGISVQRQFSHQTALRVHTTLQQMVEAKDVNIDWRCRKRLGRERRSLAMAEHVWVSTTLHALEVRPMLLPTASLRVLPIGKSVELGSVEYRAPEAAGIPSFLVVGSPDRRKGMDRLRPVAECYARRFGPCRFLVVSTMSDRSKVLLGLSDPWMSGVTFAFRSNVSESELMQCYQAATALFHPARYESFGLPLIEAAAVGTPVVATHVGVAPDLLSGALSRFIVDGDDAEACANRLHDAVENRASLSGQFMKAYERDFAREAMVDRYLVYVREAMGAQAE